MLIIKELQPETTINQAKPITTHVTFEEKSTQYDTPNFTIKIPKNWKQMPRPAGQYKTFIWQTSESGTNGQVLTVYEDTIPASFAVNRVLILTGGGAQPSQTSSASDNCSKYTRDAATKGKPGEAARWQDVDFICDQSNKQRDTIGTSSTDGINTVILKGTLSGAHKYFFTYSSYNAANPDYTPFYTALNSFQMK